MPSTPKVIVKINGQSITGWTYATITASLERIPRTFEVGVVQAQASQLGDVLAQPLEIWLDHGTGKQDKVLTGYIDTLQDSLQESNHEIIFAGRGVCSDLVDCSTELTSGSELIGMSASQVTVKITGHYDIQVVVENPLANVPYKYAVPVQVGDSAYSAIEYIARATNCLLYENADGSLVLGSAGSEQASFTDITHLKAIRSTLHFDVSSVYADYEILAAQPWVDTTHILNPPTKVISGTAHDKTFNNRLTAVDKVPRYRKLRKIITFVADPSIYGNEATAPGGPQQIYADYLCNRLNGRAQQISVTVQGWTDDNQLLWVPNQVVNVNLTYQSGLPLTLLVSECTYSISPTEGTTTTMILMPKTAFSFEPISGQAADVTAVYNAATQKTPG